MCEIKIISRRKFNELVAKANENDELHRQLEAETQAKNAALRKLSEGKPRDKKGRFRKA